jgi:hypothetical protein
MNHFRALISTLLWIFFVSMSSRAHEMTGPDSHEGVRVHWPHLLGKPAAEVERAIKLERPELVVVPVSHNAMVTMDMRLDRVRLFSDGNGNVVRSPRVG